MVQPAAFSDQCQSQLSWPVLNRRQVRQVEFIADRVAGGLLAPHHARQISAAHLHDDCPRILEPSQDAQRPMEEREALVAIHIGGLVRGQSRIVVRREWYYPDLAPFENEGLRLGRPGRASINI